MVVYKLQLLLTSTLIAIVNFMPFPAQTNASKELHPGSVGIRALQNDQGRKIMADERSSATSPVLKFRKQIISSEAYETAAVFDVDHDGNPDIVSGAYWYSGPGFTEKTKIGDVRKEGEFYDDFSTIPIDVNGDGLADFMVLEPNFSAHVYDNSGKELWQYKAPEANVRERSEFEAPGVIWDFDKDGKADVAHWRMIDDKEWLVIADGITGQIKKQTEWPTKPMPHVYNNFRLAIAKLTPGAPNELAVFTDYGGAIN
ncbi:MAG: VCBS repeat-containing protein, partial [Chitinophagaceae bacterium]